MSRAIWMASLIVVAACGKKNEEAVTPGSSAPETPSTMGSAAPTASPADAMAAMLPRGDAMAAATADARVATVDPCSFATREEMEKITAGWTKEPQPVVVTATVLGGCKFELANRYVTIDAHPLEDLAMLVPQTRSAKERGFPPKTTATSIAETGDTYVTFEGTSYILHVHADAGEGNPDVKLASKLAALLAKGAK